MPGRFVLRLERIKYMDEEKKLRDALAADRKLKELAAARGRYVSTV